MNEASTPYPRSRTRAARPQINLAGRGALRQPLEHRDLLWLSEVKGARSQPAQRSLSRKPVTFMIVFATR